MTCEAKDRVMITITIKIAKGKDRRGFTYFRVTPGYKSVFGDTYRRKYASCVRRTRTILRAYARITTRDPSIKTFIMDTVILSRIVGGNLDSFSFKDISIKMRRAILVLTGMRLANKFCGATIMDVTIGDMTIFITINRIRTRVVRCIPYPFIIMMRLNKIVGTPFIRGSLIMTGGIKKISVGCGDRILITRLMMIDRDGTIPRKIVFVIGVIIGECVRALSTIRKRNDNYTMAYLDSIEKITKRGRNDRRVISLRMIAFCPLRKTTMLFYRNGRANIGSFILEMILRKIVPSMPDGCKINTYDFDRIKGASAYYYRGYFKIFDKRYGLGCFSLIKLATCGYRRRRRHRDGYGGLFRGRVPFMGVINGRRSGFALCVVPQRRLVFRTAGVSCFSSGFTSFSWYPLFYARRVSQY